MPETVQNSLVEGGLLNAQNKAFTADDETQLRDVLKRCPATAIESAVLYRKTRNPEALPPVIIGIIERFVEPDLRPKIRTGDDELRLVEDVGIDSLTMMEIVVLVEEVLQMPINNEELRNLRTVGDVKLFIDCKVRGLPMPTPPKNLSYEQISLVMPIQAPFLFLTEASVNAAGATGKYVITGKEFFLQGHFKDNPVMPASMMLESLGQLGVLYLLQGAAPEAGKVIGSQTIFFTGCEGVRAHRVCKPGDTLSLTIKPKRMKMPLATFEGAIRVGQEKAVIVEEFTLTFGYVDTAMGSAAEAKVIAPPSALQTAVNA